MVTDWKASARIVDRGAMKRKLLADPVCRATGERAANCHHLIGKGQGGDDVEDNLIPLTGSGSSGAHGALHGNPFTDGSGRRWEARDVRQAIGLGISLSEFAYVVQKLGGSYVGGVASGRVVEFLREQYHVEVESLKPFRMQLGS